MEQKIQPRREEHSGASIQETPCGGRGCDEHAPAVRVAILAKRDALKRLIRQLTDPNLP